MDIAGYEEAGLIEMPTKHDILHVCERRNRYHHCNICRAIKRPAVLWKNWRRGSFNAEKWFNFRNSYMRKFGAPPGRASLTGFRTGRRFGRYRWFLVNVDHDHPRIPIKENISYYREKDTWINFSPSGGFQELYWVRRRPILSELEKAGIVCGGKLLTSHDILFQIPPERRHEGIKSEGPAYFCHEPTTINGRAYWWFDESRINSGDLEIRRLDL